MRKKSNDKTELMAWIGAVCFILGMAAMYIWLMLNGQIVALL